MRRPWHIWLAFGICLAVLLAAMGYVSLVALRLDRAEAESWRRAAYEEDVRLALWRMDSALAPLIAEETARPYFEYGAFYPAERAYNTMFAELDRGEVLVPSPLLVQSSPFIVLHFQIGPDGALTSPQVPIEGNTLDIAESVYSTQERIDAARERLAVLGKRVKRETLALRLPAPTPHAGPAGAIVPRPATQPASQPAGQSAQPSPAQQPAQANPQQGSRIVARYQPQAQHEQQDIRNAAEYQTRQRFSEQSKQPQVLYQYNYRYSDPATRVSEGAQKALWVGDALLLARRVTVNGRDYVQGAWLDWPALRSWLLGNTLGDLFRDSTLRPEPNVRDTDRSRMLTALPVRFVPGPRAQEAPRDGVSPIVVSLAVAWGCVLLAAAAVAALLRGAVTLSERRGAFVSAVTHELRTPLTTFRMYTEMLGEGMVAGEAERRQYVETLRVEANRLSHLVENVLSYARLERGRARARLEDVPLAALVERVTGRLADRAAQAGMTLAVSADGDGCATAVRVDASAVEQVLFNLVDNACKYASDAEDRRIHLEASAVNGSAAVRVRDHGPGLTAEAQRRLFRPFSKSAREAASSAPGVGLGLALSRRLARGLGGDLHLDPANGPGATFVLTLPTAR